MLEPGYTKWTARELRRGLTWGQGKLLLQDWTVEFLIDPAKPQERFGEDVTVDDAGAVQWDLLEQHIELTVNRRACKKHNFDPLRTVFHELGHVAVRVLEHLKEPSRWKVEQELLVNLFSELLYELWHFEHPRKGD